jgi:hypothetical protein
MALARLRRFVADYRRTSQATRLCKQGERFYEAERFTDAIGPLRDALILVGVPQLDTPVLFGVQGTVRLTAVTLLAMAAAKSGDRQLALATIQRGLAVVAEFKLVAASYARKDEYLRTWEEWARSYLAYEPPTE